MLPEGQINMFAVQAGGLNYSHAEFIMKRNLSIGDSISAFTALCDVKLVEFQNGRIVCSTRSNPEEI